MKEIGTKLKEARESIGVSIEEAAEDNELSASQLENIESGNVRAFKDVYNLSKVTTDRANWYKEIVKKA